MQFQIVTFGNGEILKGVFDAIAMCLNSENGTLYTPLIRIGMIFGVLWAAIFSIWGDVLKAWGKATLPLIFIPPLLFIPSTTVYIHDVVSNYRDKVDHVPYGLAYVSHFISQIGYAITKQVDQVFADVEDLKYHKAGFLMASNLIQQAKTFRITNEDVASNMREFVCQCVAYEAMLGYKYTFEDLRHSADLWELVSARPSKIRSFIWKQPHKVDEVGSPPQIINCAEGVKRFNQLWAHELDRAKSVLGTKLFGHTNPLTAKQEFLKYLPTSYGFLSGISKSADQILKQQMMIHAVVDGIEQKSTSLGNAPNFAARRAYLQQRSTYETLGAMASESLMTMKAVLEAIAYASFIFLVPLAILPFGVRILLSWLQTLLWLQMWAPLYAVLNFMMSMGARVKSLGMLSTSSPEGVTLASSVGLMNLNADIAAMAGYLAMSIPFLAIALVKGVGSFVHMASHLGNVSQGAAAQAAGDAVTGNYSFGNISQGNQQIANTSMLAQSHAASYRGGAFQFVDGRTDMTTMGDGSQVVNIGTSNLPVSIHKAESDTAQLSEMASQNYQKSYSLSENSAKSISDAYRQMVNLSTNLAKSESMNDGVIHGVSAEQSSAIQQGAQLIQKFADSNNISTDKAAQILGSITAGTPDFFFVKASLSGQASVSASDQDLLQKAEEFANDQNFQQATREATQASKNIAHNLTDESSKRMAEDVSGSYEKGMQQRSEASKSYQEAESYNNQAMNTKANASSINAAHNQQYFEWLADQPADNTTGRIGHRGAADIIARQPQEAMVWGNKYLSEHGLTSKAHLPNNPGKTKASYDVETGHQRYTPTHDSFEVVSQQGSSIFANDLSKEGKILREDTSKYIEGSTNHINERSEAVHQQGSNTESKVKAQQGRYVTKRAGDKFYKEGMGTSEDLINFKKGEPQQK